jgi:hypothetical protein
VGEPELALEDGRLRDVDETWSVWSVLAEALVMERLDVI